MQSESQTELKGWRAGEEGRLLDGESRERTRPSKKGQQKSVRPSPRAQREGREREWNGKGKGIGIGWRRVGGRWPMDDDDDDGLTLMLSSISPVCMYCPVSARWGMVIGGRGRG